MRAAVEAERPHLIVPEIEAIATATLVELEAEGWNVIPTARAARLTMDREGIRKPGGRGVGAADQRLPVRVELVESFEAAVAELGLPIVVKPVMSSSGKGQSVIREPPTTWKGVELRDGRASAGGSVRVIAEAFVDFDYEITLLTVRTQRRGHAVLPAHRPSAGARRLHGVVAARAPQPGRGRQRRGAGAPDHRRARRHGAFGVEFFIKGEQVIFSELSPRPHDTGMVTMATQDMSEFELHARAILGLPIGEIRQRGTGASAVILAEGSVRKPAV